MFIFARCHVAVLAVPGVYELEGCVEMGGWTDESNEERVQEGWASPRLSPRNGRSLQGGRLSEAGRRMLPSLPVSWPSVCVFAQNKLECTLGSAIN